MRLALFLGVGSGIGVAIVLFALAPTPPALDRAILTLHTAPTAGRRSRFESAEHRVTSLLLGWPMAWPGLQADLAVTGRDPSWFIWSTFLWALVGVALLPVLSVVVLVGGAHLPWGLPVAGALLGGPLSVFSQVVSVRAEARKTRHDFAVGLSAYLDLVVVSMAAGRGIEGALSIAADVGSGRVFDSVRHALNSARLTGAPPWEGLDGLGQTFEVPELSGLASAVQLAGASGAKVRQSLSARAAALRDRALADARGLAESDTERMSVPVVLLVLGFIVLVGYPAVMQISTQL